MAGLVINDTSYAGTFAPYFILPAIYGMDTVNKGCIYVQDGIKKKTTIGTLDFTKPWQPRVANPVSSPGAITIGARTLTPQDMMLYQPFNPRDLESHWEAEKLSPTLLARELPSTFENYVTALIVGRAMEQNEGQIWMGSTNYQNNAFVNDQDSRYQLQFFDGLLKQMIADANVYKAAGAVTITAANIGTIMLGLYQTAATNNKALIANPQRYKRLKFLMSINTSLIYEEYLTTQPYKNNDTTEAGINKYKGYEIVPLAGLPDNTIVFTESMASTEGNIWLGLNSTLDDNFLLARVMPASEEFFIKMLAKMDVNYGYANKVFVYTTLVAADFIATS
jgi:hypothetical protein